MPCGWPGSRAGSRAAGWAGSAGRSTGTPTSMSTTTRCGRRPGSSSWPSTRTRSWTRYPVGGRRRRPRARGRDARDWTFEGDLDERDSLDRSFRAALALEAVVDAHDLDGGAFNCHVPQFRFGEPIGIAPCWALGRLTTGRSARSPAPATSSRPWRCSRPSGSAGRPSTTRSRRSTTTSGEVVIANSGEHDLAWSGARRAPAAPARTTGSAARTRTAACARCSSRPGSGDARRLHAAPRRARRVPLRRRARRADRRARSPRPARSTARSGSRDGPVEDAWARWAQRRRQPPQLRDARATCRPTSRPSPGTWASRRWSCDDRRRARSRRSPCATCATSTRTRPTSRSGPSDRSPGTTGCGRGSCVSHDGCTIVERREDLFEEPTGHAARAPPRSSASGTSARSSVRSTRRCIAPVSHAWRPDPIAPLAIAAVRPLIADRLAGLAEARPVRAVRGLRPPAADRGHRPRPGPARCRHRHARPGQGLDGGGPRLAALLRRGPRVAAPRRSRRRASSSRSSSTRSAPGATDPRTTPSACCGRSGRRSRPTGASRTSSTTPSSCSKAVPRRRPS